MPLSTNQPVKARAQSNDFSPKSYTNIQTDTKMNFYKKSQKSEISQNSHLSQKSQSFLKNQKSSKKRKLRKKSKYLKSLKTRSGKKEKEKNFQRLHYGSNKLNIIAMVFSFKN